MYTAAVLEDGQRHLLQIALTEVAPEIEDKGYLFETSKGDPIPHHMTINMGDFDQGLNCISMLGMPVEITIDGFWYDHALGVAAARVTDTLCTIVGDDWQDDYHERIKTINEQPHITMCLKTGVKPFLSNKLDWSKPGLMLKEPMKVRARIQVCN